VSETGSMNFYVDGKVQGTAQSMSGVGDLNNNQPLYMATDIVGDFAFTGFLDEVKIWSKTLTQNEVREKMHLTAYASQESNLVAYYQFNNTTTGTLEYDKKGTNNLTFNGTTVRVTSTAPVGGGTSFRLTVNSSGTKDFTNTDCQIEFPASSPYPDGEIVVTKLNIAPDQNPATGTPLSNKYWIVNNYGTNANFSTLTSIKFSNLGVFASGNAGNYLLYKRASNSDATWGANIDNGDVLTPNDNTTLTFSTNNNITSFSQFTIARDASVLPIDQVAITWQVADEKEVNHYIIERSFDGKSFVFLKKEEKGSINVHQPSYLAHDDTPQYGTNYYRLKIVEIDGSVHYSTIKSVVLEGSPMSYQVYPNPTADKLNIEFVGERAQVVDFELINAVGQIVYRYTLQSREGKNHLFFNTNSMPVGLYSLKIRQGNAMKMEKVVIQ
jgi:hypothetical protein